MVVVRKNKEECNFLIYINIITFSILKHMRYTGPKKKLCRREGINLFGTEKYDLDKGKR